MEKLTAREIVRRMNEARGNIQVFRWVPQRIIQAARRDYDERKDIGRVVEYILSAFSIYRASFSSFPVIPYQTESAIYEWLNPDSDKFSWESIDAVILGGRHVEYDGDSNLVVEKTVGKTTVHIKTTNPTTGKIEKRCRSVVEGSDNLPDVLRYEVDFSKTAFALQQKWQESSLRGYVTKFDKLFWNIKAGTVGYDFVGSVQKILSQLETPLEIAKNDESKNK